LRDAFSEEGESGIIHGSDAGDRRAWVSGKQGAQAIGQGAILEVWNTKKGVWRPDRRIGP